MGLPDNYPLFPQQECSHRYSLKTVGNEESSKRKLSNHFLGKNKILCSIDFALSPQESHCLVDIIEGNICHFCSFSGTLCQNSIQIPCISHNVLVANLQKLECKIDVWNTSHTTVPKQTSVPTSKILNSCNFTFFLELTIEVVNWHLV